MVNEVALCYSDIREYALACETLTIDWVTRYCTASKGVFIAESRPVR